MDTVTFCALKIKSDDVVVEAEETVSFHNWGDHLAKWVDQHDMHGTHCYVAFTQQWYQFLQLDRPHVDDSEISEALPWPVKDLVNGDQPLVIDYIDPPVPPAGNRKLNVVALGEKDVQAVAAAVFNAGLLLQCISIEEIAVCELIPKQAEPVLTLIQEAGEEIILSIIKDGQLFVSRRLKGFENLGSFSPDELKMGLLDSLNVQIQRSMDYFESQLRQAPVRHILLRLDTPHTDVVAAQVMQVVAADVKPLEPAVIAQSPLVTSRLNYTSLGMALIPWRAVNTSNSHGKTA